MKMFFHSLSLILTLAVFSCVTINIYFPAEELRGAADKIVNEVWGVPPKDGTDKTFPPPAQKSKGSGYYQFLTPASAYAAQDINVSTPAIRSIKESIKQRAGQLIDLLSSGNVGLSHDGLLKTRNLDGLGLKEKGQLNQLVKAENQDRLRLYQEIANANNFPDQAGEVQSIFADSWRDQAQKGWYLEGPDGIWAKK
jgi:uncharacterized protein YdbL (DUF1318 family)